MHIRASSKKINIYVLILYLKALRTLLNFSSHFLYFFTTIKISFRFLSRHFDKLDQIKAMLGDKFYDLIIFQYDIDECNERKCLF